jgi:hypothetical protein
MNEEENKDYTPIEPVIFEFNGFTKDKKPIKKKYIYDYHKLTIPQAEAVIAIGQYRVDQFEFKSDSIENILKSKSYRYISLAMRYLLTEMIDNKPMPWEESKVNEIAKLLEENQAENYLEKMEAVYNDFFTAAGKSNLLLSQQQIERRSRTLMIMFTMLQNSLTNSISEKLLTVPKDSKDFMTKGNSKEESMKV